MINSNKLTTKEWINDEVNYCIILIIINSYSTPDVVTFLLLFYVLYVFHYFLYHMIFASSHLIDYYYSIIKLY